MLPLPTIVTGERGNIAQIRRFSWPRMIEPDYQHWCLTNCSMSYFFPGTPAKLYVTLRKWHLNQSEWRWFWVPSDRRLLKWVQLGWEIWIPERRHRTQGTKFKSNSTLLQVPPVNVKFARVEEHVSLVISHGACPCALDQQSITSKVDFHTFIGTNDAASCLFPSLFTPH